jgi:hypothetical protein
MKYIITKTQRDLLLNQTVNEFVFESRTPNNKLKKVFFNKLYKDFSNVEIIRHGNFIWFIDRDKKIWHFIYNIKTGKLQWKLKFNDIFINQYNSIFSMSRNESLRFIMDWVEEVIGYEVSHQDFSSESFDDLVDEVLAHN